MNSSSPHQWHDLNDRLIPSVGYVTAILEETLGEHSNDWSSNPRSHYLLRKTGIFVEDILLGDFLISPKQLAQLLNNIKHERNDLSFAIGQRLLPGAFNELSILLMSSPNLESMLNLFMEYWQYFFPLYSPRVRYTEKQCFILFEDNYGLIKHHKLTVFMTELITSAIVSYSNWACRQTLPWQLSANYAEPSSYHIYDSYDLFDLRFDQHQTALILDRDTLDIKCIKGSLTTFMVTKQKVETKFEAEKSASIICLIREIMRQDLSNMPSLQMIADELGLSIATLKRKLKNHHTSYQSLCSDVRGQESHFLQAALGLTDDQISNALNFYDVSNFRRFLKRWQGA